MRWGKGLEIGGFGKMLQRYFSFAFSLMAVSSKRPSSVAQTVQGYFPIASSLAEVSFGRGTLP